ncbi:MAG: magnesium transporter MgtC [Nitrospinae bacterium CG11_big_fil_rev_8_21_14_0_20_56_8]|nr:MAG: magnesium transporter MgtC [Nitrospinae bacterium CG11_big_fil_rev_8_21_14_0_20_56_8]
MAAGEWGVDPQILIRLILSIILGGVIGLEREIHGRPAGFRTHVMVCLGSATLILASEFSVKYMGSSQVMFNPDRLAAGIITGIGFLGAGAIMREQNIVRGLTTAGCIWFVAGLGIVVGKGFYSLAILATLGALAVLTWFRYMEFRLPVTYYQDLSIHFVSHGYEEVQKQCEEIFRARGIRVDSKNLLIDNLENEIRVRYRVIFKKTLERETPVLEISKLPGVRKVIL